MKARRRTLGSAAAAVVAISIAAACSCPCVRGIVTAGGRGAVGTENGGAPGQGAATPVPAEPLQLSVACNGRATRINPLIYGIAYSHMDDSQPQQWQMGATIRRWGGNNMTRYNWEIGALNLDSDWFYENVPVTPYTTFLDEDAAHGVESALTVPTIGWVAKDGSSFSFPVSVYGPQARTDQWKPEAGNGVGKDGKDLVPGPPTRTSVEAPPEWLKRWVQTIRANDARTGHRSVHQYILDNEPALWNHTHRDVRVEPLGYDELLDRTIRYGGAIREANPDAVIAGPAEWGWMNYIYSAKDSEHGFDKADRKAHGDVPLIEFYLRKLRDYEKETGIRILDVVDLHYYPESEDRPAASDDEKDARRIRSTRSLWDPDYVDESWIHEKIRFLPRVKEWIDKNYPGRGFSIGEWNFGGDSRMSGGLATAEALGRYAEYGVTSAFYWTFPPANSPTMLAFASYRNFDGKGGRFLDWFLPSTVPRSAPASFFVSRDDDGKHLVAVVLNLSPTTPLAARIDVSSCGPVASEQAYAVVKGDRAIAAGPLTSAPPAPLVQTLPPYSITIIDIHLAGAMAGVLAK